MVAELARLKQQKLVVISLHQEVDIAQLLGQWLPAQDQQGCQSWMPGFDEYVALVIKQLIVHVAPLLADQDRSSVVNSVIFALDAQQQPIIDGSQDAASSASNKLEALEHLELGLQQARSSAKLLPALAGELKNLSKRLTIYRGQLKDIMTLQTRHGVAFKFVEGPIVEAARQGHWILLDNINSAPPEIIERLNPLLEESPSLNLYEYGSGKC